MAEKTQRRLAAILAADVVGYSRLMEQDEAETLAALNGLNAGSPKRRVELEDDVTKLTQFLAGRGPAEMYEAYWIPCTLWPFAVSLSEIVSPGDQVLDVGAGTGLLTELASARVGAAGQITALEPTPFMAELLHQKYDGAPRIRLLEGRIEEGVLPEASFDVVLCNQVVQYLADLPAAFSEMRRVLKPGGKMGVGVWSGPQDQGAAVLEDGFRTHFGENFAPIHAWSFGGLTRLEELATGAGFAIDTLKTQKKLCKFKSVEEMMNVHIAGGMRVEGEDVLMGIFDLADASFEPKTEALLLDLRNDLGDCEGPSGLEITFASDILIATA